jgi:restriction system protein
MARAQRLAAQAERRHRQDAARQQRIQKQHEREQQRSEKELAKEEKRLYFEGCVQEAKDKTEEVEAFVEEMRGLLAATLEVDDAIPFDSLREEESPRQFHAPNLPEPMSPYEREFYLRRIRPMGFLEKIFGAKARFERETASAESAYDALMADYKQAIGERNRAIDKARAEHELAEQKRIEELRRRNAEVDEFALAYGAGEPKAIIAYCTMVLERSEYPEGFPQEFRIAYSAASKELVVDYELPIVGLVPTALEFRYVKAKDSIEEKPRKTSEVKDLFQDVVAAVAIRTLHEVFEADQGNHLAVAVFNGFVSTRDAATGQAIRPCLISVRSTKQAFAELDLAHINKRACLRNLGAQLSPQPSELQPVKPLIEFDMVDRRFVEGSDLLADLESRPNLMDLTPFEFENLVGNLFSKMGLESKQTRSSRDGGVDVVAFDTRPIIGGKVVIQAKRYKNTVGLAAVRDLFGTMSHEGANKGILVTTSSFGPDAYDFIKSKPIELIDGAGLLYYLEERAGIKARIVFPLDDCSNT